MHILLIHQAFASIQEPGGTRHHELARFLAARGHRVTIIASPVSYLTGQTGQSKRQQWINRQQDGPNITILRTYTYPALHRSFFHRILSFLSFMLSSFWAALQVKEVDLVWGTTPPIFQGGTAWAVARLKHVPYLLEVRDLWPAFAIAVGVLKNPALIWASERYERFLYRHADRVMVNSPGYIQHVVDRGARWVELIPNGADPDMFNPNSDGKAFRAQHELSDNFVVLYAGAHGMSNDLGVVLQAAQMLKDNPKIKIIFLGDGKEKANLIRQAEALGCTNVLFLPPLSKEHMPEALAASNACIAILKDIPLYATTYPNKVFDYLAAGRPVVLAIDGVIREVVEEAGAGIFARPGDPTAIAAAIRQLADDPNGCTRMGTSGRKAVEEKYSRAVLAEKLVLLFEEMRWNDGRKNHGRGG